MSKDTANYREKYVVGFYHYFDEFHIVPEKTLIVVTISDNFCTNKICISAEITKNIFYVTWCCNLALWNML